MRTSNSGSNRLLCQPDVPANHSPNLAQDIEPVLRGWHGGEIVSSLPKNSGGPIVPVNLSHRGERSGDVDNPDVLMQAKAGDRSVLGRLLIQFSDLLTARARESFDQRLRGRIGESDLVMMTLTTATEEFPAFRGKTEAELVGWLKAILEQHMAATARWHLRTQKRAAGNEILFPGLPTANSSSISGGESALGPAASGPTPSRFVMQQELRNRIRDAITELPWEQQEAVRLKFIDEWPLAEIAEFMGKTERAVAGLVARGMKRLKELLKDVE